MILRHFRGPKLKKKNYQENIFGRFYIAEAHDQINSSIRVKLRQPNDDLKVKVISSFDLEVHHIFHLLFVGHQRRQIVCKTFRSDHYNAKNTFQMKFGISVYCVCQACKSKEYETNKTENVVSAFKTTITLTRMKQTVEISLLLPNGS